MVYKGKRSVFVGQPPRIKRCWEAPRRKSRTRDSMLLNITLTSWSCYDSKFLSIRDTSGTTTRTYPYDKWYRLADRQDNYLYFPLLTSERKKFCIFSKIRTYYFAKIYLCVSLGVAIFLTHKRPVLSPWSSLFLCSVSSTGLFSVIIC